MDNYSGIQEAEYYIDNVDEWVFGKHRFRQPTRCCSWVSCRVSVHKGFLLYNLSANGWFTLSSIYTYVLMSLSVNKKGTVFWLFLKMECSVSLWTFDMVRMKGL